MGKKVLSGSMSRRDVFKLGSLTAVGVAGASMLGGCAPSAPASSAPASGAGEAAAGENASGLPSFLVRPADITDFTETKDYDVVVVGAGAAGLAAAIKAAEEGAKVAVVQKESVPSSQGFRATGLDLDKNDKATQEAVVSYMMRNSDYRPDRSLLRAWTSNGGEAIKWYRDILHESGVQDDPDSYSTFELDCNGYTASFISAIPETTFVNAISNVAEYATSHGVDLHYSMPGVQLMVEDGNVTGVVAGEEGKYVRFNAAKGVVLATGDYQCNNEMIAYYCPDVLGYPPLEIGRDGDGHRMGVWAGGHVEPVGHTKMIHDIWMNSAPYLMVGPDGARLTDEHMPWWKINTIMRPVMKANADSPDDARVWSIMDAQYLAQAESWAQHDSALKAKEVPSEKSGVMFTADTIEGLAEAIGIEPAALKKTVDRYNEVVAKGVDEDFGKDAVFLAPVAEGPFYAVQRDFNWGLSATLGGLVVNAENQVLNDDAEPIKGLYAAGNASGPFFGSIDYPMEIGGLSVGRAITTGYIAGRAAAKA